MMPRILSGSKANDVLTVRLFHYIQFETISHHLRGVVMD